MSALTPDHTILGLLAIAHRHGYQLITCFHDRDQLGDVWRLSTSQIYAVLKRLEAQGWIVGEQIAGEDAPARIEYRLMAAGKTQFEAWLNEAEPSPSVRRVRVEFASRLYIAHALGLDARPILDRQRATCRRKLASLRDESAAHEAGMIALTRALAGAQLRALIDWIDTAALDFAHEREQGKMTS